MILLGGYNLREASAIAVNANLTPHSSFSGILMAKA